MPPKKAADSKKKVGTTSKTEESKKKQAAARKETSPITVKKTAPSSSSSPSATKSAMKKAAAVALAKAEAAGLPPSSRAVVGHVAKHATVPTKASVYPADKSRNYWLIKSEPFKWSWDQMLAVEQEPWDGVRNYQAANNMKKMALGDLAFFYHSNEGKEIVGIVQCVKLYYPDPSDDTGKGFGMVDFAAVSAVPKTVGLHALKEKKELQEMDLVRQGRLSVCSMKPKEWDVVCSMAGIATKK